jgi:hypothetical protein
MNTGTVENNQVKIASSWVIILLIFGELSIIAFFALVYGGKTSPLIRFDENAIPSLAAILVAVLILIGLYLYSRKAKRISDKIIAGLKTQGFSILANRSSMFSKIEGNYRGLKCRLSFGTGNDDTPDYYVLSLFHEKRLNLRLVCTNILPDQTGRQLKLPLYKPFGAPQINLPNIAGVRCWAADRALGERFLDDGELRDRLKPFVEAIAKLSGRFVIDDDCIKLAFAADVPPEPPMLESAYNLCLGLGRSSLIPSRPLSLALKEKAIKALILAAVFIFMVMFVLTIFHGH